MSARKSRVKSAGRLGLYFASPKRSSSCPPELTWSLLLLLFSRAKSLLTVKLVSPNASLLMPLRLAMIFPFGMVYSPLFFRSKVMGNSSWLLSRTFAGGSPSMNARASASFPPANPWLFAGCCPPSPVHAVMKSRLRRTLMNLFCIGSVEQELFISFFTRVVGRNVLAVGGVLPV